MIPIVLIAILALLAATGIGALLAPPGRALTAPPPEAPRQWLRASVQFESP